MTLFSGFFEQQNVLQYLFEIEIFFNIRNVCNTLD